MSRGRGNLDPKRVSSELFTLTYGCMVAQLLKDFDSPDEVRGFTSSGVLHKVHILRNQPRGGGFPNDYASVILTQ